MGRPKAKVPVVPIFNAQQLSTVYIPAATFLPEFRRTDRRHEDFLGARAVHFLADNVFDFPHDAQPERQKIIYATCHLAHHTGAQ